MEKDVGSKNISCIRKVQYYWTSEQVAYLNKTLESAHYTMMCKCTYILGEEKFFIYLSLHVAAKKFNIQHT